MKATIIAIGKCKRNSPEKQLIDEYVKRSGWDVVIKEQDNATQEEEARFLTASVPAGAKVIVLDEPTSSLTVQEVDKLFEMMRMLKGQGIALIYISHKMDEIFEICDEISVLRDGNLVMTKDSKETDMNELMMVL